MAIVTQHLHNQACIGADPKKQIGETFMGSVRLANLLKAGVEESGAKDGGSRD
jgi:hypothetical protein